MSGNNCNEICLYAEVPNFNVNGMESNEIELLDKKQKQKT